eukprot:15255196-Alexandrium_andersonii.AAC.1
MAGMAMVLLLPARRAAMVSPGALLSVYADARNVLAGDEEGMGGVEGAWRAAERATALRNNEDKTQR